MSRFAFCSGKFIKEDEPCLSVNDRGFLFGDAVFTTIKVLNGLPEFFEEHVERLKAQCDTLSIEPPIFSLDDVLELILKNRATSGTWRLKIIVTGGERGELYLPTRKYGKLLMMIKEVHDVTKNYRITVFPKPISSPISGLKTLSYLERLWIMNYAIDNGFDDAIALSIDGFIMETAFSNIFWVVEGEVFTPSPDLDLLVGIQLTQVINNYKKAGYRIHFVKMKLDEIPQNGQFFICNVIKGVVPVSIN